ncbi:MAG: nucleotidyltransferase family protein [Inquilinaceae bacterium]
MTAGAASPDRAMILAAGLGTRMRPLSADRPKPLVEVAGRALIDHVLDRFQAFGVGRVVVNTHHHAERLEAHLASRASPAIAISRETDRLETGGGVRRALPLLGPGPFFVANADALWRDGTASALARLAGAWEDGRMDGLLLLVPTARAVGADGAGDFDLAPDDRLVRRVPGVPAPYVYGGVHITHPRLFEDAPDGAFSLNLLWDRALAEGRLHGLVHDGAWHHVGNPAAVAVATAALTGAAVP